MSAKSSEEKEQKRAAIGKAYGRSDANTEMDGIIRKMDAVLQGVAGEMAFDMVSWVDDDISEGTDPHQREILERFIDQHGDPEASSGSIVSALYEDEKLIGDLAEEALERIHGMNFDPSWRLVLIEEWAERANDRRALQQALHRLANVARAIRDDQEEN